MKSLWRHIDASDTILSSNYIRQNWWEYHDTRRLKNEARRLKKNCYFYPNPITEVFHQET